MARPRWLRFPGPRGLVLGLVCGLAVWLSTWTGPVRRLEDWFLDGCFSYRGTRPSQAKIVLIGLDDASLDELHKPLVFTSPELAKVVTYLHAQGAAAVGLDLIVPEKLSGLANEDEAQQLGRAILKAKNVVLAKWKLENDWLLPLPQWQLKSLVEPRPTDLGFVNLTEDDDSSLRRQQLYFREDDDTHVQFGLALLAVARGARVEWDGTDLWVGDERVPLDADQQLPINFVGPPGTFPVIPFRHVLAAARGGAALDVDLQGAIVIVGVTARSQQDYHATPYANSSFYRLSTDEPGLMSGPEIHANIIATLADRAYLRSVHWLLTLPGFLVSGGLLGIIFARLNLVTGLVVMVAHHFAWKGLCLALFAYADWHVEMVPMLLLGFLTYAATFALRWRRLRNMFGVFKSEAIARALEADPRRLGGRGAERIVTVLFADIRNFTDFSESHSPHEVVALLNAYFGAVVPVLEAHGGAINVYMGDGVMVLFGIPVVRGDHALRAVRAAVAMVRRVHELRDTWTRLGNPGMRVGVGVHTGKVVVGSIGSPRRLDYTAVGDTVNTAARIETANKELGTEILISSATHGALPPAEAARLGCTVEPRPASVKGKKETLYVYPVEVA